MPYENATSAIYYQNETIQNLTRVIFNNDWDSCKRIDANFTEDYWTNGVPGQTSVPCDDFVFDDSKYKSSTVIEVGGGTNDLTFFVLLVLSLRKKHSNV